MTYEEFEKGLRQRGFIDVEGVCNMGCCNKDENHYILLTDGLVIYSNTWDWKNDDVPDGLCEIWSLSNPEESWLMPNTREFSFEELDAIMKI